MTTDLTFFTNEKGYSLLERFQKTLKDVKYFDVIVGYFRMSGFFKLYESMQNISKIRILVGINVDKTTADILEYNSNQLEMNYESHYNTKKIISSTIINEMDNSQDNLNVELGIKKFLEFINTKKLEIRAYPTSLLHAKVYISRFSEEHYDYGRIITGSSNFSESGFIDNLEFNVELKNKSDVTYALEKFENLWNDSVNISNEFTDNVTYKTWLNDQITPYELYLKFLYEYFKEEINSDNQSFETYLPDGYMKLKYQENAVIAAEKILNTYNGVFLADVVGLGKTYISALLAQKLNGKILIICPPVLKQYWEETFFEFGIRSFKVESLGKLDNVIKHGPEKFDYIFIDEAHRFRNEMTEAYKNIQEICYNKKVILVSATPLNNTIQDIYSQLKLFQIPRNSTIPGIQDLEKFFNTLKSEINKHNKDDHEYVYAIKDAAKQVRDNILKYVMVRRTRTEVAKYFSEDLKKQGMFFPEVNDPIRIVYSFDSKLDQIFNRTIEIIKEFSYSRYTPLLYLKKQVDPLEVQSQRNIGGFMKVILIKRLESSFHAFKNTLNRFIESYEKFIDMFNKGNVYISKKIDVYDYIESDNEDELIKLVDEEKVQKHINTDFQDIFITKLNDDLKLLKEIKSLWHNVNSDPKISEFIDQLGKNKLLKNNQLIIFTESRETGEYLYNKLSSEYKEQVIFYYSNGGYYNNDSKSTAILSDIIKENYDPKNKNQKKDIKILITTDVLAEGINLHRSNIIINYDLPWNPTRVLQRVGRINRVGTKHTSINIYNFFPTTQSDEQIGLEASITSKIQAFHDALGEDAKYLTDEEELSTHELFGYNLFNKLNSKQNYTGEEESQNSELEYLQEIRKIRDNDLEFFEKIKNLPRKARSCKRFNFDDSHVLTFFRKGMLKKFILSHKNVTKELDFFETVNYLKCEKCEKKLNIGDSFYKLLEMNKNLFEFITSGDSLKKSNTGTSHSNEGYIIKRLKANDIKKYQGFTDDDEEYIKMVTSSFENGIISKKLCQKIKREFESEINPLKILAILKRNIPNVFLDENISKPKNSNNVREVILSEYLIGSNFKA